MQSHIDFVTTHLKVQSVNGPEYNVLCPNHDDRNSSCRVNVDKGLWFCHGCHTGGGMKTLARLVGVRYNYDATDEMVGRMMSSLNRLKETRGEETVIFRPESDIELYRIPTGYYTDPIPRGRGLTQDIVDLFELGYDPIQECAVIPVRDRWGHLLGFTRRYLNKDARIKYRDPKGFQKRYNLYGAHLASVHPSGTVVLVEGLFDTMKIWQAGHVGLGQFGSYLTIEQIRLLKEMGTVCVIMFYDNDKGGRLAYSHALGYSRKLVVGKEVVTYTPENDLRRHFIVKRARYPFGARSATDPGNLSDLQIEESICKSRYLVG